MFDNNEKKTIFSKKYSAFCIECYWNKINNFLLVPLYTNAFTTAEYGTVDLINTIVTILVPIITINIGESVMRFALDENSDKNHIMSIGLFFAGLSLLLGISVVIILSWFPNITVNWRLVYLYCVSQGVYQIFSCNLRGQEKLMHYAAGNILNTFMNAALNIFFLLVMKVGVDGYFYAYIISFTVAATYCFLSGNVISTVKNYHIDKTLMKYMTKYSIVLVPNSFMWWIMNSSDHIMVTSMISIGANGVYAISYKLPSILSALSTVFNQAWSYSAIHENKSSDKEEFNNAMYDKLVRFQLMITVFLMCIMKPFLKIYVQPSYYHAWKYTPYLLVGNFFLTMGTFLSTCYTVNKDSKGFLFSGLAGAGINVTMNWILIPQFGIHGAAFATCISYIIVFLYRVIDTRKYMVIHVFKPVYVIEYMILIGAACTMAIPAVVGQVIMVLEFFVLLMINYRFIRECMNMFCGLICKLIKL